MTQVFEFLHEFQWFTAELDSRDSPDWSLGTVDQHTFCLLGVA